jgi:hypothetical protein
MGPLIRQFAPADITANTAFGRGHKFHERPRGAARIFNLGLGYRGAEIAPAAKERAVRRFQFQSLFRRKPGAAQTDNVQPANFVHAMGHGKRRQVLADGGPALHHRQRADACELMHQAISGNKRAVLHHGVSGQDCASSEDDMIAEHAVMRHVRMVRDEVVGADDSFLARLGGALRGEMFAEDILIPDAQSRRRSVILQILGRIADHATGVEFVLRANRGHAGDVNMRSDDAARSDFHRFINHSVGPDLDGGVQFRFRMNNSRWMNHRLRKCVIQPDCQAKNSGRWCLAAVEKVGDEVTSL